MDRFFSGHVCIFGDYGKWHFRDSADTDGVAATVFDLYSGYTAFVLWNTLQRKKAGRRERVFQRQASIYFCDRCGMFADVSWNLAGGMCKSGIFTKTFKKLLRDYEQDVVCMGLSKSDMLYKP